jgi:hypothetical protein
MGGGLMQLVAYGAQDVYLTGNPQITFWKVTYRRHTNFAMESIEQTFNGQADFGRRVTCTISRNGDLAYRTYLQVTLPEINQQMLPQGVPDKYSQAGNSDGTARTGSTNKGFEYGVFARWLDFPGEQMISMVEVEIGGQRIDRQYGDWMHIWNQLTLTAEQQRGYYKMVGNTTQLTFITDPSFAAVDGPCSTTAPTQVCAPRNALPETTLYVPFQFWYCRNPGLALPLIALQYHEIKINLDLRPIDECLWAVSTLSCGTSTATKVATAYQQSLVAASLYVDYVFLDTDERRRMAQNPHEYLIEQLQFTGDESVGSSSNKIKLNFNHPCKELVWVVQPDANVDYCSSLICGTHLFNVLGAQPFNYTDAVDVLPNGVHAFAGPGSVEGPDAFITPDGLFEQAGATDAVTFPGWVYTAPNFNHSAPSGMDAFSGANRQNAGLIPPLRPTDLLGGPPFIPNSRQGGGVPVTNSTYDNTGPRPLVDPIYGFTGNAAAGGGSGGFDFQSSVSDAGTFVLTETSLDMHCWGENPVVTAKLQLNGQDRFSEREGTYFDLVQPYQHHTRSPDTGINVYSFALRPEEHQPSGTCNFSRIDNATLQLVLSNATVGGTNTAKVRVYATNYNVLRIMSGMGGLAYSN